MGRSQPLFLQRFASPGDLKLPSHRGKRVLQRAQVERKRQGIAKSFAGAPSYRTGTDGLPEFTQPPDPFGFWGPRDDGGIERAD
jgi:hypothetical protein